MATQKNCGRMYNPEVHHQELRSHSGSDIQDNLITLCEASHRRIHRQL
jgi:hypothetical protein